MTQRPARLKASITAGAAGAGFDSPLCAREAMTTIARLTSPALVGRDRQLHTSLTALRCVRPNRPGIAVVQGPAGIGKTRFVTALVEALRDDGAMIFPGARLDLEPSVPYSPLIEAFRAAEPAPTRLLDALTAVVECRGHGCLPCCET